MDVSSMRTASFVVKSARVCLRGELLGASNGQALKYVVGE